MFIVIGGATASGKSSLAVNVAQKLNGEIIGADSMQIYRKMNIGTAKISEEEKKGIPHYLIDIIEPFETFSVAQYASLAKDLIKDIENRGKTPIICGGTGLYINSLIYDYQMSSYNESIRKELTDELNEKGIDYMYNKLLSMDKNAISIHKNNIKRVIRALEVIYTDGKSISDKDDKNKIIPHLMFAPDIPRNILYDKINKRVDIMFETGLEEEVNKLLKNERLDFSMQSMQAIGYKEFKGYYNGEYERKMLIEKIKQHSRNYAKRQETWFRRIKTCKWLNYEEKTDFSEIIANDYYKSTSNL